MLQPERLKMAEPPGLSGKIKHFSVNKANTYRKCPRQFYYKYIEELPTKNNGNFVLGSAADRALEVAIKQLNTIGSYDMEIVHEAFTNHMLDDLRDSPELSEEDIQIITEGAEILHSSIDEYLFWLDGRYPEIVGTQIKIENWYPDERLNYPVLGFIDMLVIDDNGKYMVVDHKTKKDARVSPDYRMQLLTYCMWVKETYNLRYMPRAELHVLLKQQQKKDPSLFRIKEVPFHSNEISSVKEAFFLVEEGISKEFYPPNRWHELCSSRWCDFFEVCHNS